MDTRKLTRKIRRHGTVKSRLVVNTISGRESTEDDILIRRTVIEYNIPYITTLAGFKAATAAVVKTARENFNVKPLQEYEVN